MQKYGTSSGLSDGSRNALDHLELEVVSVIFRDRVDAGKKLARALGSYKAEKPVVYALPRGGVVVGAEVARSLDAFLDLIIVRKVGHPFSPEYAIAAVAEDGHTVVNRLEVDTIDKEWFEENLQNDLWHFSLRLHKHSN